VSGTKSVFTVRLVKKGLDYRVVYWYGDGEMSILATLKDKGRAISLARTLEKSLKDSTWLKGFDDDKA